MIKALQLLLLFLLLSLSISAGEDVLRFRLYLTDKHQVQPTEINSKLSSKSLDRRFKQNIPLDSTDVPVYNGYLDSLKGLGMNILTHSRWMNSVVISVSDSSKLDLLANFAFIKSIQLVWMNPSVKKLGVKRSPVRKDKFRMDSLSFYGRAETQLEMLGLDALHQAGYKGEGVTIALIDAGFYGVDTSSWFKDLNLLAARDFIYPPSNIYNGHSHGAAVLSLLATKEPYQLIGSAPDAAYCLLRSEDVSTEFPIEEDYWVAAAEFADSMGVDIIHSSLGYTEFDIPSLSYKKSDLDGRTAFISQAAAIAASKGMLIVVSAGNDGESAWRKISMPADSKDVLSVGSVQSDLIRSTFSSVGPTADGRIKPDVMAMGHAVSYVSSVGVLTNGYGTSFSSPLVSGMAACLWNALPNLKSTQLKQMILESSDRFTNPDSLYGYGIPNAQRLWLSASNIVSNKQAGLFYCYTSAANTILHVVRFSPQQNPVRLVIYNTFGMKIIQTDMTSSTTEVNIALLPNSLYFVDFVESGIRKATQKFIIQR